MNVDWPTLFLLLGPTPLLALANVAKHENAGRLPIVIFLSAASGMAIVLGLITGVAGPDQGTRVTGVAIFLTGAAAGAVLVANVRRQLARVLPMSADDIVHLTALWLSVVVVGAVVANQVAASTLAPANQLPPQSRLDVVVGELPYLLAGVVGVGLLTRRSGKETFERLGFTRPRPWEIVLALAAAGAFFAIAAGFDYLGQLLDPVLTRRVDAYSNHLFSQLGDPLSVLFLAFLPGICEEALFRGAMQPRFGLVWTALVFAALHTEYGFTWSTAAVLVLAVGLGVLRRYLSTTVSSTCHVAYNLLVASNLPATMLWPGAAVEGALVVFLIGALVRWRWYASPEDSPSSS